MDKKNPPKGGGGFKKGKGFGLLAKIVIGITGKDFNFDATFFTQRAYQLIDEALFMAKKSGAPYSEDANSQTNT